MHVDHEEEILALVLLEDYRMAWTHVNHDFDDITTQCKCTDDTPDLVLECHLVQCVAPTSIYGLECWSN